MVLSSHRWSARPPPSGSPALMEDQRGSKRRGVPDDDTGHGGGTSKKSKRRSTKSDAADAGQDAGPQPAQAPPAAGHAGAGAAAAAPDPGKLELPGKYSLKLKNRKDDSADFSCKISKIYTSAHLLGLVGESRLTVTGNKGYRLSRATHAVAGGDWYYEVTVDLNQSGHVRIGWAQGQADMDLPCGCEHWSYAYRDVEGTRFNNATPKAYAAPYATGDVIGCRITLPDTSSGSGGGSGGGGAAARRGRTKKAASKAGKAVAREEAAAAAARQQQEEQRQVVYWGQMAYYVIPHREIAQVSKHKGSAVRFYKNGVDQGVAFSDVWAGEYYPAVSLYKDARVTFNFGPDFKYPPPGLAAADTSCSKDLAPVAEEAPEEAGAGTVAPATEPASPAAPTAAAPSQPEDVFAAAAAAAAAAAEAEAEAQAKQEAAAEAEAAAAAAPTAADGLHAMCWIGEQEAAADAATVAAAEAAEGAKEKRLAADAAEQRRSAAEEEAARIAAEQEAARVAVEQETARVAAEQQAARVAAENEAARIAAERDAARAAAEQEAASVAAEQQAARVAAEQQAARVAAEQQAARLAQEVSLAKQAEAARAAAAQEAAQQAATEVTAPSSHNGAPTSAVVPAGETGGAQGEPPVTTEMTADQGGSTADQPADGTQQLAGPASTLPQPS
jgi:hypothetical protein